MNKYLCSLPWVHLRLDLTDNGQTSVSPCCKFNSDEWRKLNPDNHVRHGIKTAMNTAPFKKIRSDMLAGIPIKGCIDCYEDEKVHGRSMRTDSNKGSHLKIFDLDLTQEFFHTKFIEITLDNTCNLECKMCSSLNSSKLRRRDELLGHHVHPTSICDPDLLDEMDLSHVEYIKMVGGEPLLSKNHLPFLRKFPNKQNLSLLYNTNATIVPSGETLDIMKSVKELNFIISCDGIYKYNDYQRWGSNFESIIENASKIQSTFDNINWFTFLNTFTLLNLNAYSKTIEWFKQNNIETMSNWGEGPLSVCHAPDWYEEWILEENDHPEVRSYFKGRQKRKYDPKKWQEFIDLIKITDKMYGSRLEDYNPELAEQLDKHNN